MSKSLVRERFLWNEYFVDFSHIATIFSSSQNNPDFCLRIHLFPILRSCGLDGALTSTLGIKQVIEYEASQCIPFPWCRGKLFSKRESQDLARNAGSRTLVWTDEALEELQSILWPWEKSQPENGVNTEKAESGDGERERNRILKVSLEYLYPVLPETLTILYCSTTWTNTSPFWLNSVWARFCLPSTKELKQIHSGV